jgi:DNA-binding transcriptional LysR family regulator
MRDEMPTNVSIDLLRTVVTLARLRSYTKTAQALGVTQPAISGQMRRLQLCFSYDIFDRSAGGVQFTPRGKDMLRNAQTIIEINDQLLERFGAGSDSTGSMRRGGEYG